MRRPVKPFVTEYKASGRRGKEGRPDGEADDAKPKLGEAAPQPTDQGGGKANGRMSGKGAGRAPARGPASRGTEEGRSSLPPRGLFRSAGDAEPLDSYEAAMRAADALFAPKSKADAPAVKQAAAPRDEADPATAAPAPAEPVGRVLRALDEPEPVVAEPEPEPAPKRRGRKPGSLNRPKPSVDRPRSGSANGAGVAAHRQAASDAVADDEVVSSTLDEDEVVTAGAMDEALPDAERGLHPAGDAAVGRMPAGAMRLARQRDRFSWVKTTLRPGEKWKRRLPKVAW